jgi:hypothetical protein
VRGQTSTEDHPEAHVKRVGQGGRIVCLHEIREEAPNEPSAPRRAHVEEQLHTRTYAGETRREPVIDLERFENEEPRLAPIADPISNELVGREESDGAELSRNERVRVAVNKLASWRAAAGLAQLHSRIRRPQRQPGRLRAGSWFNVHGLPLTPTRV